MVKAFSSLQLSDRLLMTNPAKGSTAIENDVAAATAAFLLANYSFDLGGSTANELVEYWLGYYPSIWLRLAVIEALYQGRYKAVSVAQILSIWGRRHQAIYHFSYEFERLICHKLPQDLAAQVMINREEVSAQTNHLAPCPCQTQSESATTQAVSSAPLPSPFESIAEKKLQAEVPFSVSNAAETPHVSQSLSAVGKSNEMHIWGFSNPPIDQFIPANIDPDLYSKLKAIAEAVPLPSIIPKDKIKAPPEASNIILQDSVSPDLES